MAHVIKHGGRPIATNDLPTINGDWLYFEDDNGAIVHLDIDEFSNIETFLARSLGVPDQAPTDTSDGGKLGWYSAGALGAAVQFGYDTEKSYINIIRPISHDELAESLERIAEEK